MMVPLDSARQYYPKEKLIACDVDHAQMPKLKRGQSGIYPNVRWTIKHAVVSAAEEQRSAEMSRLQISERAFTFDNRTKEKQPASKVASRPIIQVSSSNHPGKTPLQSPGDCLGEWWRSSTPSGTVLCLEGGESRKSATVTSTRGAVLPDSGVASRHRYRGGDNREAKGVV